MRRLESTTIRVDLDVYNELRKHIQDFSDTPNAVLRRILNIDTPQKGSKVFDNYVVTSKRKSTIDNRIEGDTQRKKLYEIYGNKLNQYPILYSTAHMVSPSTKKYFFGISKYNFEEQVKSKGYIVFICGNAQTTFFVPAQWILNHIPKPLPQNLKINIMLENDKNYFWQNKKDGILLNNFVKMDR